MGENGDRYDTSRIVLCRFPPLLTGTGWPKLEGSYYVIFRLWASLPTSSGFDGNLTTSSLIRILTAYCATPKTDSKSLVLAGGRADET